MEFKNNLGKLLFRNNYFFGEYKLSKLFFAKKYTIIIHLDLQKIYKIGYFKILIIN